MTKPTSDIDELKQALKKDFRKLYVKQFSTDYEVQRMVRELEIDVMSLENTAQLMTKAQLDLLDRLEKEKKFYITSIAWKHSEGEEAVPLTSIQQERAIIKGEKI